jgi:integrase
MTSGIRANRSRCLPAANVLALQSRLGHKSAKVTLDTYADLFDADLNHVAVTLDGSYSPEIIGKMWAPGTDDAQKV